MSEQGETSVKDHPAAPEVGEINPQTEVLNDQLKNQTQESNEKFSKAGKIIAGISGASAGSGFGLGVEQYTEIISEAKKQGVTLTPGNVNDERLHNPVVEHIFHQHDLGLNIAGGLLDAGLLGLIGTGIWFGVHK